LNKKKLLYLLNNFSFLGHVYSKDKPYSNDVIIYKIGDYANFTEVNSFTSFVSENTTYNTSSPASSIKQHSKHINNVILAFVIFGIIIIIGFIAFIWYKKTHQTQKFSHVLNN